MVRFRGVRIFRSGHRPALLSGRRSGDFTYRVVRRVAAGFVMHAPGRVAFSISASSAARPLSPSQSWQWQSHIPVGVLPDHRLDRLRHRGVLVLTWYRDSRWAVNTPPLFLWLRRGAGRRGLAGAIFGISRSCWVRPSGRDDFGPAGSTLLGLEEPVYLGPGVGLAGLFIRRQIPEPPAIAAA